MIHSNNVEPAVNVGKSSMRHTAPGNGKVCVTWLEPSGSNVIVEKIGGTNARRNPGGSPATEQDGCPMFGPWGGWQGDGSQTTDPEGAWQELSDTAQRPYVGLYTVRFRPAVVNSVNQRFLMTCDVMNASDTPDAAAKLTSDAASVAARVGATAVVFSAENGGRSSGNVAIPTGIKLVILSNLPPDANRTLTGSGGLTVTSPERRASQSGVLVVEVSGSGQLQFS
jgi:hypothetical protein